MKRTFYTFICGGGESGKTAHTPHTDDSVNWVKWAGKDLKYMIIRVKKETIYHMIAVQSILECTLIGIT